MVESWVLRIVNTERVKLRKKLDNLLAKENMTEVNGKRATTQYKQNEIENGVKKGIFMLERDEGGRENERSRGQPEKI